MTALISLLIVLALSMLISRIATMILMHTGLSRGLAQFQARSAFTGVGYTTDEAEKIVSHPVRRRIVMLLMLLGNAGIVTSISSLLLAFISPADTVHWALRLGVLFGGIALLWWLATSAWMDRAIARFTLRALNRWTRLDVRDYVSLLHLAGDYRVTELNVSPGDWLANQTLAQLRLRQEGITVLGIQRQDGRYIGAPTGRYYIRAYDTLLLYGRTRILAELDERNSGLGGELAHQAAVSEQASVLREQEVEEVVSQTTEAAPRIEEEPTTEPETAAGPTRDR